MPPLPAISIGNIVVGGTGKTPLLISLAKRFERVAVVTKGYGRKSVGTFVVSEWGQISCDVDRSGDEAMMMAKALPQASVIVCDDRMEGAELAKNLGARALFFDDAFHAPIKKLDLVIDKPTPNIFCLPSGPYRLPRAFLRSADMVLKEGVHFWRRTQILNPTNKMVLLAAIADPRRLDPYLPKIVARYHFKDHHHFQEDELERIWRKHRPTSFLVTAKDAVKLERFSYPLSILDLRVEVAEDLVQRVQEYISKGA